MGLKSGLRKTYTATALLLAAVVSARASSLDLATVERIEKSVQLPAHSRPVDGYDRYYAPDTVSGRKVIVGLYLATDIADERERYREGNRDYWKGGPPRKGQRHLLLNASLLPDGIDDGGCEEIHVYWDVSNAKIAGIFCNGPA